MGQNTKIDFTEPVKGLNFDINPINLNSSEVYTHALNVRQESEDGNSINLTNESSNTKCVDFPKNIIGYVNIIEQGKTIYFSVKDGIGEIGYISNDRSEQESDIDIVDNCTGDVVISTEATPGIAPQCTYNVIVRASCLNFSIDHPIHSAEYNITNKSLEIYWTDNFNPPRWLDINNIPYFDKTTDLDCNLLKIFPDYDVPVITPTEELSTGSLVAGMYEFFVSYSNKNGKELSPYFSATNGVPIFESIKSDNFDFVTSKSIKIIISNIDQEFRFINIAVSKIISGVQTYELVGTFDIVSDVFQYVYTGDDKLAEPKTRSEILFKGSYYDKAGTVATQNRLLMWGNLTSPKRINYQEIASAIHLQWETWKVPYNKFEGYYNGINTANIRGYMRDEVYAFSIVFFLKSGQYTDRFPLVGRIATPYDREFIHNQDALDTKHNPCDPSEPIERWKVYNTGSVTGVDSRYLDGDDCYIGPHKYGEFGYWESTDRYPNDPVIWGALAGQLIRHFKFPDNLIVNIHDNSSDMNYVHSIYPIGLRVSDQDVLKSIADSSLDQIDKDNIVGYQIIRANRGDNATVIAKGMLFNVGKYNKDGNSYYYPNYNYNDLRKDPFISQTKPIDHTGSNDGNSSTSTKLITINNSSSSGNFTSGIGSYSLVVADYSYNVKIPFTATGSSGYIEFALYISLDSSGVVEAVFDTPDVNFTELLYSSVSLGSTYGNLFITLPINSAGNSNPPLYITVSVNLRNNSPTPFSSVKNVVSGVDVSALGSVMSYIPITVDNFILATHITGGTFTAGIITKSPTPELSFEIHDSIASIFSDIRLDGFKDREVSGRRFTFMSPQTSFARPALSGLLKLESVEYGSTTSHIIDVKDNPKYTIGTQNGVKIAVALACSTLITFEGGIQGISEVIKTDLTIGNFLPGFMTAFDLVKKLIPFRQYGYQSTSIGVYNQSIPVQNTGNKIRSIDLIGYLDPGLLSIGDDSPINNYQRESSVYIRTLSPLPYPHDISGVPVDNSRFTLSSYEHDTGNALELNTKVHRDISSFYGSIKIIKPDQYGQINSWKPVLTGSPIHLDRTSYGSRSVFGGDTFITRFADKRKLPFFLSNTVGMKDDTDIMYQELDNVGYPTYWMSTSPVETELSPDKVSKAETIISHANAKFGSIIGNLTTGGLRTMLEAMGFIYQMSLDIIRKLGKINTNLDKYKERGYFEEGKFYLFSYGIPYFFVESEINTDYRQAGEGLDKDFFPNVGSDVPDFWLQEVNVSIQKDNEHLYNRDYSRLNNENYFTTLPVDYNPLKSINYHATRVIYSEPYSLEDNQNNWLVYRANNYYDFPLVNGELIDLNGIESDKVLARFENNTAVYGAYITLDTDNKTAITGTGEMFKTPPQEFTKSSVGYAGTQHKSFVSTKYGHFWIDAKRGEVFQFDQSIQEISKNGMRNWFKENLPFKILKYFKVNVDNSFKDFGLSMTWDNRYERLFITKKDYIPLNNNIIYDSLNQRFTLDNIVISPKDGRYFCDASWTIAYSPRMKSWVSFYSFLPDYYVSHDTYFQSGHNNSIWNHNHSNRSFQIFYGTIYPFEIETITKTDLKSSILNSISYKMDVFRYTNSYDWKLINNVTFDKASISSTQNTSGNLNLVVNDPNNLSLGITSIVGTDSITIPVVKTDDKWNFNKFSDVTLNHNSSVPLFNYNCANSNKTINRSGVDYSKGSDMLRRTRLKSDWFRVKLSSTRNTRLKKIFKWLTSKQTKSNR